MEEHQVTGRVCVCGGGEGVRMWCVWMGVVSFMLCVVHIYMCYLSVCLYV